MSHWIESAIRTCTENLGRLFWLLRAMLLAIICYLVILVIHDSFITADMGTSDITTRDSSFSIIRPQHQSGARLSHYTATLNHRSVFGQGAPTRRSSEKTDTAENLRSVLERYDILGVVWGNEPKAILLDKNTQTTMTAGAGESIGQLEVITIERGYIRFQLLGETYDAKY